MQPDHVYVHVPFCRLVCAYCDFVTVGGRGADIPRYVDAVAKELELRPLDGRPRTIYFGGGTPSLLPAAAAARLVALITDRWSGTRGWGGKAEEVTLEANPSSRETPDWSGLRSAGVNRISLGAQSLSDRDLATLARGHSAAEVRAAYAATREAGFDNVSLDLIYGIPGQSVADWRRQLAEAVAMAPEHLSLYALQLAMSPDEWAAPPRPGALRWRRRLLEAQDDVLAAAQYAAAEEMLEAAGYVHYEISSWARGGRESVHNGAYWGRLRYTGLGAGAHSYDGADTRSWNERDLDRYLEAVEDGRLPDAGREQLDEPTRAFEAVALGLRAVSGFSRAAFAAEFGEDPVERYSEAVATVARDGLLAVESDRLRLTPRGRLLANDALLPFLPEPPQLPERRARSQASAPA